MIGRDWYVGMKVECIDDAWEEVKVDFGCPHRGRVYTVKSLTADPVVHGHVYPGVWIGVCEVPGNWDGRPEFSAKCFRPVQPRKTDISVFHAMLKGKKETVRA